MILIYSVLTYGILVVLHLPSVISLKASIKSELGSTSANPLFAAKRDSNDLPFHNFDGCFASSTKKKLVVKKLLFSCTALMTAYPQLSRAELASPKSLLENKAFEKSIFNLPPSLVEYPSNFEGDWKTKFSFTGGSFTDQIPYKSLSQDPNIPGFRKYSIVFAPDVGAESETVLRFMKKGNKVIEDRAFNLANLLESFMNSALFVNDGIEYDFGNRCSVQYHDGKGFGKIETFTNSRSWGQRADGFFETSEQIRQSSVRSAPGRRASQLIGDYCIRWLFKEIDEKNLEGYFQIFSYIQPQDEFYFIRPSKPVGVFQYTIKMNKI